MARLSLLQQLWAKKQKSNVEHAGKFRANRKFVNILGTKRKAFYLELYVRGDENIRRRLRLKWREQGPAGFAANFFLCFDLTA